MAIRRGACKRKLQFGQSQEENFSSEGATASQQGCNWVASSWEALPVEHGEVVAVGYTQTCRLVDGYSRTSAVDQHQRTTDAGAAGAAHGGFTTRGFWSPVQHITAALQQAPTMAANCSPIAASPAAIPSAPVKVCRLAHPVAPVVADVLPRLGQSTSYKAARVLQGLSSGTQDLQQVQDWLTAMGV